MILHTKEDNFATHTVEKLNDKVLKTVVFTKLDDFNTRKEQIENLIKDKGSFCTIKFPNYTVDYQQQNLTIVITSEYIDGKHPVNNYKWNKVVLDEVVKREHIYTLSSFSNDNYIETADGQLYYIDIDDYRKIDFEERVTRFCNKFLVYGDGYKM
jgi:hypothetical protein